METLKGNITSVMTEEAYEYVKITIAETGESFDCSTNESVLEGMRRLGKRGIPVGCRSGGCSVCKCQVVKGEYHQHRPMSTEYISKQELEENCVLTCCIKPKDNLEVKVIGKMHKNICEK